MITYRTLSSLISYPYILDITSFGIPQSTYPVNDSEGEDNCLSLFSSYHVLFIEAHTDGYLIISLEAPSR